MRSSHYSRAGLGAAAALRANFSHATTQRTSSPDHTASSRSGSRRSGSKTKNTSVRQRPRYSSTSSARRRGQFRLADPRPGPVRRPRRPRSPAGETRCSCPRHSAGCALRAHVIEVDRQQRPGPRRRGPGPGAARGRPAAGGAAGVRALPSASSAGGSSSLRPRERRPRRSCRRSAAGCRWDPGRGPAGPGRAGCRRYRSDRACRPRSGRSGAAAGPGGLVSRSVIRCPARQTSMRS